MTEITPTERQTLLQALLANSEYEEVEQVIVLHPSQEEFFGRFADALPCEMRFDPECPPERVYIMDKGKLDDRT